MALTDYVIREKLPELWRQIDNTHLSYLETDDSPEKLDQRKKLEGYILDYLYLVPHENKFTLPETAELLSRSALLPDFSAFRLARGWAALARYASNLLVQHWRKEYRTIRLYSGFYKHEVEGSGLADAGDMLRAMGYRQDATPHTFTLDGPVCPDLVTAVSRDSLIAYVECQIMIQIWEEVSIRGGSCSWLEVLRCREDYPGDVDQAAALIIYSQRLHTKDIYSNVKFGSSPHNIIKNNLPYSSPPVNDYVLQQNYHPIQTINGLHGQHINPHCMQPTNGYIQNGHGMPTNAIPIKTQVHVNPHPDPHNIYCSNFMMQPNSMNGLQRIPLEVNPMYRFNNVGIINQCAAMSGYYSSPMNTHPYLMQPPLTQYGGVRQATTLPLSNGYHCPPVPQANYCQSVPTAQLIELDIPPSYPTNSHSHHNCPNISGPEQSIPDRKRVDNGQSHREPIPKIYHSGSMDSKHNPMVQGSMKKSHDLNYENQENARRNSAPRSSASYTSDNTFSIPRSDTQPSLSKAREDGMGTFESWDYVFRNLESQGYSKDLGERGNILSPPLERDSKTLGRASTRDPKRYQQTTMDLEDALHAIRLEKDSDEELYRTAKINETLLKIKQDSEAKAAKANNRRHILADEKDKRKSSSYENATISPAKDTNGYKITNDKTRLISKEETKDKKEMDKNIYVNGNNTIRTGESRKVKKSIVKCLSSENDTTTKRRTASDQSVQVISAIEKAQAPVSSSGHHVRQHSQGLDSTDAGLKTRLVVSLHDQDKGSSGRHSSDRHGSRSAGKDTENHSKGKERREIGSAHWECGTCTFVNSSTRNACEMCAKSRQLGVEATPLMSGGKECPTCTLVNKRDATVCTVCETDLKHSPTYI